MNTNYIYHILGAIVATLSICFFLWRKPLGISVALIGPLLANLLFWGCHYLIVLPNDGLGTRGWLKLFFVYGVLIGYLWSVSVLLICLLVSYCFHRGRRHNE